MRILRRALDRGTSGPAWGELLLRIVGSLQQLERQRAMPDLASHQTFLPYKESEHLDSWIVGRLHTLGRHIMCGHSWKMPDSFFVQLKTAAMLLIP